MVASASGSGIDLPACAGTPEAGSAVVALPGLGRAPAAPGRPRGLERQRDRDADLRAEGGLSPRRRPDESLTGGRDRWARLRAGRVEAERMGRQSQGVVWLVVVIGHAGLLAWLMQAMVPPTTEPERVETVMYLDLLPPPPPDAPDEPPQPRPEPPPPSPPADRPPPRRIVAPPMQAVFEEPAPPAPATSRIDPADDPFHRPQAPAATGFGRRDVPLLPESAAPRVAGEAPPNAPLRGLRHRERLSPQQLVGAIGSFIAGGPNAPVEAPCGGRMNGGTTTAEGFSPAWDKHYGCTRDEDGAGFDGTATGMPDR
jgi:hypothetical protein